MANQRFSPHEGHIQAGTGRLYFRELGQGQPIIILHGGPDFNHSYLLPAMDHLSDAYRLIYYDQRGRGKSAGNVQPEDVSIVTETEDLERLREYFQLDTMTVLGHSWGGVLAMEYTLRHPARVSHLILMNTAPASHADYELFHQDRLQRAAADIEKMKAISSSARYATGDLETDAEYYRIHFKAAIRQPEQLENLVRSLRANFTAETIRKARAIEDRLMEETWYTSEYDLLPKLKGLHVPALVIHGDCDLIPAACAQHIAEAIPGARFVLLKDSGHFAFIENPEGVRRAMDKFLADS
jgi:proline iminopeptidase